MVLKQALSVVLIALMVSCFVLGCLGTAKAESIPKPSVPEFTVLVTDHSYDVETTTTTTTDLDGRIITSTTPGYHMLNGSITISIKNQPFTSYYDSDGYPINLYYHIRAKLLNPDYWHPINEDQYFEVTNSAYTQVTYGYQGHDFWDYWGGMPAYSPYQSDGTVDFQVEAFIGHTVTTHRFSGPVITSEDLIVNYVGQTSGWSDSQTATIPSGAYTPTLPNPTVSPTLSAPSLTATSSPYQNLTATPSETLTGFDSIGPLFVWLAIGLLVVVAVLLVVAVGFMRRRIGVLEHKLAP
jgi:hypothetical protein